MPRLQFFFVLWALLLGGFGIWSTWFELRRIRRLVEGPRRFEGKFTIGKGGD